MKKLFGHLHGYTGYVSLFTVFIAVIILVISGFYGWQKYQEHKFPEKAARGEIKDFAYYFNGIKNEIDNVLGKKETKGSRAMELSEGTKVLSDRASLYSLEVPKSWAVVANEGNGSSQISRLVVNNSYFSQRDEESNVVIEKGAQLEVRVTRGENRSAFEEKGGHANLRSVSKDIKIAGKENAYHLFREPNYPSSDILDDHLIFNGNTYLFRLTYNPLTFSEAEYTFQEILSSVKFK